MSLPTFTPIKTPWVSPTGPGRGVPRELLIPWLASWILYEGADPDQRQYDAETLAALITWLP